MICEIYISQGIVETQLRYI